MKKILQLVGAITIIVWGTKTIYRSGYNSGINYCIDAIDEETERVEKDRKEFQKFWERFCETYSIG